MRLVVLLTVAALAVDGGVALACGGEDLGPMCSSEEDCEHEGTRPASSSYVYATNLNGHEVTYGHFTGSFAGWPVVTDLKGYIYYPTTTPTTPAARATRPW